jgi:hypothetical protein
MLIPECRRKGLQEHAFYRHKEAVFTHFFSLIADLVKVRQLGDQVAVSKRYPFFLWIHAEPMDVKD